MTNSALFAHDSDRIGWGAAEVSSGWERDEIVRERERGKLEFAVWYSAVAALLVFNSHLERLYPRTWLAGDGLLGNSMFFFLSGWGIAKSWRQASRPFLDYARRRFVRIYPTLIFTVLLLEWLPGRAWHEWTFATYVGQLLYPTNFTYVRVIIPGYVLLYLWLRLHLVRWSLAAIGGMAIWYVLLYATWGDWRTQAGLTLGSVPNEFHLLYYYSVIALGAYAAGGRMRLKSLPQNCPREGDSPIFPRGLGRIVTVPDGSGISSKCPVLTLLVTGGTVGAYLGAKFWMALTQHWHFFAVLHLLCLVSLWPLFETARIGAIALSGGLIEKALVLIGGLTLEIYLTHELLLGLLPLSAKYFPLEIGFLFAITLGVSYLIQRFISRCVPK